ncbi:hypothetical protein ACVIGB_000949 [Bradyrhizobium sp. USDA 4341]
MAHSPDLLGQMLLPALLGALKLLFSMFLPLLLAILLFAWFVKQTGGLAGRIDQQNTVIPFRPGRADGRNQDEGGFRRAKEIGDEGEKAVSRELCRSGFKFLHDIVLQVDGRSTQIDHLVAAGGTLVCVEVKAWNGTIYGGRQFRIWTKYGFDGGELRIQNPLHQNRLHMKAVERYSPGADVRGLVVATGKVRFKEPIEGVVNAKLLVAILRDIAEETPRNRGVEGSLGSVGPLKREPGTAAGEIRSCNSHEVEASRP